MTAAGPYPKHLDTLIALVTYLALSVRKSRTAPGMATALSLDEDEVRTTLTTFTGISRRSTSASEKGELYFTLHARYALRAVDADEQDALPDPLVERPPTDENAGQRPCRWAPWGSNPQPAD